MKFLIGNLLPFILATTSSTLILNGNVGLGLLVILGSIMAVIVQVKITGKSAKENEDQE